MKRVYFTLVMLFLAITLNAQLIDLSSYIHQSAITPTNQILLRLYAIEQISPFSIEALTLQDGVLYTETFQSVNISEQQLIIPAPDIALPQIAFRVQQGMVSVLIPWQITTAQAAQPLYYILTAESPEGVTTGTSDNYTDLRTQSFSTTESTINVMLENAAGSYPSSMSQMYMYGSMVLNADRLLELDIDFENFDLENIDPAILAQLHAFAIMYSNINLYVLQIYSGIYKLPLSLLLDPENIDISALLTSLNSIANITTSISSGALLLRANYSDLASDSDFGEWPNISNCLVTIPFIIHATNILTTPTIDLDVGTPTVIFCSPYEVLPQINTTVTINTGTMTPYSYEVFYSSPGGFYPFTARFTNVDQQEFLPVTTSMSFLIGAVFYFTSTTPLGSGTFEFSADDLDFATLNYIDPYSIEDNVATVPDIVLENYPNPFNPQTSIRYSIPKETMVNISVYNLRGQRVKTLVNSVHGAGRHEVIWNGTDELGQTVSSGVYFYRLITPDNVVDRKMLLLK